jgi:hypothetical protein
VNDATSAQIGTGPTYPTTADCADDAPPASSLWLSSCTWIASGTSLTHGKTTHACASDDDCAGMPAGAVSAHCLTAYQPGDDAGAYCSNTN